MSYSCSNSRVDRNLPEQCDGERHGQADEACADERDEFRWRAGHEQDDQCGKHTEEEYKKDTGTLCAV